MDGSTSPRSYLLSISGCNPINCDVTVMLRTGLMLSLSLRSLSVNSFKDYPSSCCPPSPSSDNGVQYFGNPLSTHSCHQIALKLFLHSSFPQFSHERFSFTLPSLPVVDGALRNIPCLYCVCKSTISTDIFLLSIYVSIGLKFPMF